MPKETKGLGFTMIDVTPKEKNVTPAAGCHGKLVTLGVETTTAALGALAFVGNHNRHDAVYAAMGTTTAGLQVMGALLATDGKKGDKTEIVINDDVVLFCALLTAQCNHVVGVKDDGETAAVGVACTYSKENFFKAMETFEKVTGRKADTILSPDTVNGLKNSPDTPVSVQSVSRDTTLDDLATIQSANIKPA